MNQRPQKSYWGVLRNSSFASFERDGFRVMVTAVDRYLTEKEYKRPIIRDRELESLKQVLEGKACLFQQQSKGRRPSQ